MSPEDFREARMSLGLTQKELGKKLEQSTINIAAKENGRRTIRKVDVLALLFLQLEQSIEE